MPDFTNLLTRYHQMNSEQVEDIESEEQEVDEAESQTSAEYFQQWYQSDPERLELEREVFEKRGFITTRLNDGRICFSSIEPIEGNQNIIILCDWLYPLKPPAIFTEGNDEITKLIPGNDDNSLNLLTGNNCWTPEMSAVSLLDYLLEQIELFKKTKPEIAVT